MWTDGYHWLRARKQRLQERGLPLPKSTVQLQITVVFSAFMALLLILLNTYPVTSTRDAVIKDKERSMTATVSVISSALAGLDSLTGENVVPVMYILDVAGADHILVTDTRQNVVYDTWGEMLGSNLNGAYPELEKALEGKLAFRSRYTGDSFSSQAAAPVMMAGEVIGGVYLSEDDTDQAEMIQGIQNRLAAMSVVLVMVGILGTLLFSVALTRRIKELAQAVRVVQEGDYTHHIQTRGNDELTELGEEFNSCLLYTSPSPRDRG